MKILWEMSLVYGRVNVLYLIVYNYSIIVKLGIKIASLWHLTKC